MTDLIFNRILRDWWLLNLFFRILCVFQVQDLLKRLETPYSDEHENTLPRKATTDSSCSSYQTPALFNMVLDAHDTYSDKPPDDAFNMRLTWSS